MSRLISLVEDHITPPLVCFLESQRKYHGSYHGLKGNLSGMCFFPLLPYVSLCMPLTTKGISEHDPYEKIQPCKLWILFGWHKYIRKRITGVYNLGQEWNVTKIRSWCYSPPISMKKKRHLFHCNGCQIVLAKNKHMWKVESSVYNTFFFVKNIHRIQSLNIF